MVILSVDTETLDEWLRLLAKYGWDCAHADPSAPPPDPVFDWGHGYPRLIGDLSHGVGEEDTGG